MTLVGIRRIRVAGQQQIRNKTMSRYDSEIWKRLTTVQNAIACSGVPIDIMTFTAFFDDKELVKHTERYEEQYKHLLGE